MAELPHPGLLVQVPAGSCQVFSRTPRALLGSCLSETFLSCPVSQCLTWSIPLLLGVWTTVQLHRYHWELVSKVQSQVPPRLTESDFAFPEIITCERTALDVRESSIP